MIYIFGSLHIDPEETAELKKMLSALDRHRGIIAIELQSNKETLKALKRFRTLTDKEINKILEYQFGERRIIATFKLLKMLSKGYHNINLLVSIEPKTGKNIIRLNSGVGESYKAFNSEVVQAKARNTTPGNLLRAYFDFMKNQKRQCSFRETNMMRVVTRLAKDNPQSDILLYCGYPHAGQIKNRFMKDGIMFKPRHNRYATQIEMHDLDLDDVILNRKYDNLGKKELVELGRDMLHSIIVWHKQEDLNIKGYARLCASIAKRIKSMPDIEKAVGNLTEFKSTVFKSVR